MPTELAKNYDFTNVQRDMTGLWDRLKCWHAEPDPTKRPYAIVIPPPNVTGALHLGHALNNTLQDILTRYHRMLGDCTVWVPGTDHAGIATQTVVDKRLQAEGKPSLKDYKKLEAEGQNGREQFEKLVWAWKDEYEARILGQLKAMGCSCDWDRTAFTMDDARSAAVREAFFQLFKAGLIYRGKRLVNWDPVTQTALSDDEVEMEEIDGSFYYLRYPLADGSGHVTVATTRPETMLGDTAVAVNPKDPRAASLRGKQIRLPIVDRLIPLIEDDYVVLPVEHGGDENDPKAKFSSGFLKVTPAHDPNDYVLGTKYGLPMVNVMAADASISLDHGWAAVEPGQKDNATLKPILGLSREEARKHVVAWFKANGLLEKIVPYRHSVGHSYRSHVPVEPYLSDQWYCKVTDDRMAPAANRALSGVHHGGTEARSKGETGLRFYPERYAKTYQTWHDNIRDWCISRQLWWGHRIPVWHFRLNRDAAQRAIRQRDKPTHHPIQTILDARAEPVTDPERLAWYDLCDFFDHLEIVLGEEIRVSVRQLGPDDFYVCCGDEQATNCVRLLSAIAAKREPEAIQQTIVDFVRSFRPTGHSTDSNVDEFNLHFAVREGLSVGELFDPPTQDPDVLDTWFSSALWPLSTLGWPAKASALDVWNPTSVLCTAREIITLWVSRMVMFNQFNLGQLPFKDVFIHAMIQDGHGQKMSKSLGNGVDPLDVIQTHGADAMRFTLASMATQTQDMRMPVDLIDPHTGESFTPEYFENKAGYTVMKPVQTHKGKRCVSVYGVFSGEAKPDAQMPLAMNTSTKFDFGRNFANKLWNASKFVLMQLESAGGEQPADPHADLQLSTLDRWILSRLARTIQACHDAIAEYRFDQYAKACYDFVWRDFCDWYLEASKPAMRDPARRGSTARVLATCLDASLRLLHPAMPFITEKLWSALVDTRAPRGIDDRMPSTDSAVCMTATFPLYTDRTASLVSDEIEATVASLQEIVGAIREVRNTNKVDPKRKTPVSIDAPPTIAKQISACREFVEFLATSELKEVVVGAQSQAFSLGLQASINLGAAKTTAAGCSIYVEGVIDAAASEKRKAELVKQIAALKGRLGNEAYIAKAPAKLVEETKTQLANAEAELAKLG